jgi:hypothetical protein
MSESRVPRRIFGPMREGVTEDGDNYIMRSFSICTLYQIFRVIKSKHAAHMGEKTYIYSLLLIKMKI